MDSRQRLISQVSLLQDGRRTRRSANAYRPKTSLEAYRDSDVRLQDTLLQY